MSLWDHLTSALDVSSIASSFEKEFEAFVSVINCYDVQSNDEMEFNELDFRHPGQAQKGKSCTQIRQLCADTAEKADLDTNIAKDIGNSEDGQTAIPEEKVAPIIVVEENLIDFDQDDLVDLSDAEIPPALAQGPTDLFDAIPDAIPMTQDSAADTSSKLSPPPQVPSQAKMVEAPISPPVTNESGSDLVDLSDAKIPLALAQGPTDLFDAIPVTQDSAANTSGKLSPPPQVPGQATMVEAAISPPISNESGSAGASPNTDLLGLDTPRSAKPHTRRVVEVF